MLNAIGDDPKGKNEALGARFRFRRAIRHNTGQRWDFGNPSAVDLAIGLDPEHEATILARGALRTGYAVLTFRNRRRQTLHRQR